MAGQQISLPQVVEGLGRHFRSVDTRAAVLVTDSGGLRALLACLRVSAKPPEAIKAHYRLLEDRFGPRKSKRLRILWEAAPFRRFKQLCDDLQRQELDVERNLIPLMRSLGLASFGASLILPFQHDLQPAIQQTGSTALFSAGSSPNRDQVSRAYQDPELVAGLVKATRFRWVDEFVGTFLEVKRPSNYDRDFIVQVEMPAWIKELEIVDDGVHVEVEAESHVSDVSLVLEVQEGPSSPARQRLELELQAAREGEPFRLLRASAKLDPLDEEEHVTLVLKHRGTGLELDEKSGYVWRFMPLEERRPLVECVRLFGAYERLRERVESGLQRERAPQDVLQRLVSGLLACLGFTTFDLEREGNLREGGTGVERATLDVVAYEARRRIVLAIECTLNVPKTEDYDKLLNATAYLGRVFRARSRTRLVPILVSMQESEPVQREDLYRKGLRIFNADDVRALLEIVESGDESTFFRFLESPAATSLRSFIER